MIWPWIDYAKDAIEIDKADLVHVLCAAFKIEQGEQIERLVRDGRFLVLETERLGKWVGGCHSSLGMWPHEGKDSRDCDDLETLFRADRVRGRWRACFKLPEAMGGIDYYRALGGYHRAAWGVSREGTGFKVRIYQPESGIWQEIDREVKQVVLFDA